MSAIVSYARMIARHVGLSAIDPACVKTLPLSNVRSRLQMQRDMPLTSPRADNGLSVSARASSENWAGLKAILSVHFYVFTQPWPKADIKKFRSGLGCRKRTRSFPGFVDRLVMSPFSFGRLFRIHFG